jgi:hypothetical protein
MRPYCMLTVEFQSMKPFDKLVTNFLNKKPYIYKRYADDVRRGKR